MHRPVPSLLERRIVPKVWGGRELARVPGIELPGDDLVGESWEVYDRPEGSSALRDTDGVTLNQVVRQDAGAWLGRRFASVDRFPLLLKFIDAREALSVQLHPDDSRAVGDSGKDEAWVVLDVGPAGRIVRGLRTGVDRSQVAAAAASASLEELLHSFRPEPGAVIVVPAGTLHAIGPDVVLFEVQQNSDLTYRLYDWGRPRELHVEQALEALRDVPESEPDTVDSTPTEDGGAWLIRDRFFTVRRYTREEPWRLPTDAEFKLLTVVGGQGTVGWRSGGDDPPIFARSGDTVLVPAATEEVFLSPIGRFDVLWTAAGDGVKP